MMNGELRSPEGRKDGLVCEAEGEKSATSGTGGMGEPGEGSRSEVRGYRGVEPRMSYFLSHLSRLSRASLARSWGGAMHIHRALRCPCYFPSGISITRPPITSSILKSFLGLRGWVL